MEYDNTNRGTLFKNTNKESDQHPDYKGSINIEGVEYWLSSWIKTSSKGAKFMSLSVKPKEVKPEEPRSFKRPSQDSAKARQLDPRPGAKGSGFDDFEDVPF